MKGLLIASATNEKVTIFSERGKIEYKHNIQKRVNNTLHVDKRCPPISFYLYNGFYSHTMSERRKEKIRRSNPELLKINAINNLLTRLELKGKKNKLKWNH